MHGMFGSNGRKITVSSHTATPHAILPVAADSDIIHLDVLGDSIIVLNSLNVITELFDKRGAIYSDRRQSVMLSELMGWGHNLVFAPYGDRWRAARKIFHQEFNSQAVRQYDSRLEQATLDLLRRLSYSPDEWYHHLRHQAASTMLGIAYGFDVAAENDPHIDIAEKATASMAIVGVPGAFLVDVLPFLKYVPAWVPGAQFQVKAAEWKKLQHAMVNDTYADFKQGAARGSEKSLESYCAQQLAKLDPSRNNEYEEQVIRETASVIFAAGADTTVSTLATFVLAMLQHPHVQAAAQSELARVLGAGAAPTLSDEAALPYLAAVMKECLRWEPVAPIGVPHRLLADDVYGEYHLPRGAIVIPNTWAIMHDETLYPDPFAFRPERFLTADGQLDTAVVDPETLAFGFGRRICPGRFMARASMLLTMGSILATFTIEKKRDMRGVPIEPAGTYTSGALRYPEPFECAFTRRHAEV
ncbi:hypothetical protein HWV62_6871 [Athelia sp. TMB]|nr:hypothetical protein HWV62_6871 [Athelia sp. TMB]